MKTLLVLAPLTALMATCLAGCATAPATSWVSKGSSEVVYLSWADNNGSLAGTAQVARSGQSSTSQPVSTSSMQLSGTEADGKVTLRFGGSILGTTASGSISGDSMILEFADQSGVATDTFIPGTGTTYNTAVTHLTSATLQVRQKAAQATATSELASVVAAFPSQKATLQADLKTVAHDQSAVKADWNAMQSAAGQAQAASCASDSETTAVDNADNSLGTDLGALNADVSQAGEDDTPFADGLNNAGAVTHALYSAAQDQAVRAAVQFDTTFHRKFADASSYSDWVQKKSDSLSTTVDSIPSC